MVQNPFWPLFDEAISWLTGPTSGPYPFFWLSVKERTEGQGASGHGKQYELDQYQTGQASSVFGNTDGVFNPTDPAAPYYPMVVPYRGYRVRAQYPATINLLTASQATAGLAANDDGSFVATAALPPFTDSGGGYTSATTAAGTYTTALAASPTTGANILRHGGVSAAPGVAFTAQCTASCTTTIQLRLRLVWWNASGAVISSTLGTSTSVAGSALVTVTGTAPANVAGMTVELFINSSPAGTSTVTTTAWQVERNGTASAYVQPSRWYSLFTGLALSYPQDWADSGTYGTMKLSAVDIFGWLSQRKLFSPAYMEILAMSPAWFYALDEPNVAGVTASQFQDATGSYGPIGYSSLSPNAAVQTTPATTGAQLLATGTPPRGIGGPVVQLVQPGGASVTSVVDVGSAAGTAPPTGTGWTRIVAVNPNIGNSVITGYAIIWTVSNTVKTAVNSATSSYKLIVAGPGGSAGLPQFGVTINGTLVVNVLIGANSIADGNWHFIAVSMSADGQTVTTCVDGQIAVTAASPATDMRFSSPQQFSDVYGSALEPSNSMQLSCLAQYNYQLTQMQMQMLSQTFLNGGQPDSAGNYTSATRYADILRWAQYRGLASIDNNSTGQTVRYGPPTELFASRDQSGNDVVSALQTVVDTENGVHYVAGNGAVTFKSRQARYNQGTPAVTFGENTAGGEIPYVTSPLDYDPTRITNDAQLTQTSTNAVTRVLNSTSIATYGDIPLQRNVNSLDPYEITAAGQFLVGRNGQPQQRIQSITIPASSFTIAGAANGAAWAALLPLEVGARVRIMRRPPGATVIQIDGFVESVKWKRDDQTNASVDLQISSAAGLAFWQVSSTHSTLHTSAIAGATSCVINPLPDSTTNAIQSNISGADYAYEWVIDWGLATAEYVTVFAPTPNSPGYTTATLNLGACKRVDTGAVSGGFNFAHSAGAVIQDIGGYVNEAGESVAQLTRYLTPATALDQYSTVGTTTIASY
jgi:hypothetical protein